MTAARPRWPGHSPENEITVNIARTGAAGRRTAFDRFRRIMATIAAAIDLLVTVIKAAVVAEAL
jgi:hypothetical protein